MVSQPIEILVETLLLAAEEPLDSKKLATLLDVSVKQIEQVVSALSLRWADRGLDLVKVASGWRFQTKAIYRSYIDSMDMAKPPKYSRAVMECLAIIAYRQPVSRGDIEHIRGVPVASSTIKTLEERGWIDVVGHRDTIGRPQLFATTKQFLDDLGIASISELPSAELPPDDLFSEL